MMATTTMTSIWHWKAVMPWSNQLAWSRGLAPCVQQTSILARHHHWHGKFSCLHNGLFMGPHTTKKIRLREVVTSTTSLNSVAKYIHPLHQIMYPLVDTPRRHQLGTTTTPQPVWTARRPLIFSTPSGQKHVAKHARIGPPTNCELDNPIQHPRTLEQTDTVISPGPINHQAVTDVNTVVRQDITR